MLLHSELLGLVALLLRDGAQADLDEAPGVAALHDARKGRCVGVVFSLKGVVDVGVRVDVEDVHRAAQKLRDGAHDGEGD